MTDDPKPGERAPDFEAKDQDGNTVSLASFRGRPVILYFYPKDDTPGCTAEACSFRDSMTTLQNRGIVVLGVSVDSEESHAGFASKYKLNFTLLSDRKKSIVRGYGVESPFGTARRVTYIIGPDGIVKYVFPRVSTKTHANDVLKKVEELGLAQLGRFPASQIVPSTACERRAQIMNALRTGSSLENLSHSRRIIPERKKQIDERRD